ncbi:hypothetical protein CO178_02250 [candidate division WWE3 bacterium CG_4_9_14_3_um_filter_34_6]|uniref:NYN domain-containing protein n=1 Tax=candidate division WWE3 bacterium CG_4_9_14_3_um_filter_34_6 TaxID=1975079 RepID=A0A2M7X2S4_UNCKA|nr:MAG: hypothetical protein CO178_02250 [candidate division WWE3 bacterium CG_4_9_14_3_um_filter_34_6]
MKDKINSEIEKKTKIKPTKSYAFLDASNLFYGGEKSLGWKIDYSRLLKYLKDKYKVSIVYYFGGVELHGFEYNYLTQDTVPLEKVKDHLLNLIHKNKKNIDEAKLLLISRHLQRIKFYLKLKKFGYKLYLKPVKLYYDVAGSTQRKANCDVEMAFYVMKEKDHFNKLVFLSGDGDFLPILKYIRNIGKSVTILSRGERTAREIRQFAGNDFRDFNYLREQLKFKN